MLAKVEEAAQCLGAVAVRPPRWGGYRVWAKRIELWVGQPARVHDRAAWTRSLEPMEGSFSAGPWRATRLQP